MIRLVSSRNPDTIRLLPRPRLLNLRGLRKSPSRCACFRTLIHVMMLTKTLVRCSQIKKKKPRTSSDDDEAADPPAKVSKSLDFPLLDGRLTINVCFLSFPKPVKKSKTALSSTTITAAKRKTTAAMDAPLPTAKIKKAAPPEPEADAASVSPVAAEKKKKRKLFGGIKRPDMNFVPEVRRSR